MELISKLSMVQLNLLLLGVAVSIMSATGAATPPLFFFKYKVMATAVWASCWFFLPNSLVKTLFPKSTHNHSR